MEALTQLLQVPRARDAFLLRVVLAAPWSVRVTDEAPLTLVCQLSGGSALTIGNEAAVPMQVGDVLVVRAPTEYQLASGPDLRATMLIGPGQSCSGADGRDLSAEFGRGVRVWGNDPDGSDQLLVGSYHHDTEVGRLLLAALPDRLLVPDAAAELVALLNRELTGDEIGQGELLNRLLDLVLISTLRAASARGGWKAQSDPAVRDALAAIHEQPARGWTLTTLAARSGVSRATLAARFAAAVGEPPMTYLTNWRLAVGADLLRSTDATLASVAQHVGYASGFSFSAAFKRRFGMSPRAFRGR